MPSASSQSVLSGYRVVELTSERCALAGKLLADMGAEVIVVEPPEGCVTRSWEPYADDEVGIRLFALVALQHLKKSVVLDLDTSSGAHSFRSLVATSDVVIEAEPVGRLDALGLDWEQLSDTNSELIWTSITHHGRDGTDPPRLI